MAQGSCHHVWLLKDEQCLLPDSWNRRDPLTKYVIAAYCGVCRSHLELSIVLQGEARRSVPCPNQTWPLHHFIHLPEISSRNQAAPNGTYSKVGTDWVDTQQFQCSSPQCSAKLSVQIKPCKLIQEWANLLTATELIRVRAEKAISEEPERFEGVAVPSSTDILTNLRTYISNSMKTGDERKILGNNKKWRLCLGEPCADLVQYLGFRRDVS